MENKQGYRGASVWIERNPDLYEAMHSEKKLNKKEFDTFKALQHENGFGLIIIRQPKPHEITNPSYVKHEDTSIILPPQLN